MTALAEIPSSSESGARHGARCKELSSPPTGQERTHGVTTAPLLPSLGAKAAKPRLRVCAVIPCYNVARWCGGVARATLDHADHVIVVDDGSTDETAEALRSAAAECAGRMTVLTLTRNSGKGNALLTAFRYALEKVKFDVLVTLDGDGQHEPREISDLAATCGRGAQFCMGQRLDYAAMPLRSKVGNIFTRAILRLLDPSAPADTQSGFRAMDRAFVDLAAKRLRGNRYETELEMLLLAIQTRARIDYIPISTIYISANRDSHFRPLADSFRIYASLFRWLVAEGRNRK